MQYSQSANNIDYIMAQEYVYNSNLQSVKIKARPKNKNKNKKFKLYV